MLKGKKILLGISGSIAAYKSPLLIRLLVQAGAEVQVITTAAALDFTTLPTLSTLSEKPVVTDFYSSPHTGEWVNHVKLGMWADLMLIAPATANTLAALATGKAESILQTTYLSARCPVWVAPAMDLDMYLHPTTKANLVTLEKNDVRILPADSGSLASGLVGKGRMQEPEEIFGQMVAFFANRNSLSGKRVLITAGPTHEPIDPVRYIGNRSSGKMGIALAREAARRGADVCLVIGPTIEEIPVSGMEVIQVQTAREMGDACMQKADSYDIAVLSAAVADYRPTEIATSKIKKAEAAPSIDLTLNPDILKTLGQKKKSGQTLVGFALETNNEIENAQKKLTAKNADVIILNSLRETGAGFGHNTNKVNILFKNGDVVDMPLMQKSALAGAIFDAISQY
ncbi:MAG: bifunctional phosphopantothenoylcysteine decarboxylase/phosphopantothenate--cysteine ligase CoaBC [Flavobacteriales bacterium]|nr:bifunctional phosphopantothenoylcysteine decarboxylase/phosphopantothenate--cysteine ligase CoaBC [Flavobacteriales bacterium]